MYDEPVTLEQVKAHLRLDQSDTVEDEYLKLLITAARRSIENRTGRVVTAAWPTLEDNDKSVVRQAVLLLAGSWYMNREAVTIGAAPAEMPLAVHYLLDPLRVWVV